MRVWGVGREGRGSGAEAQGTHHVRGSAAQNCQTVAPADSRVGGVRVLPWGSTCLSLGALRSPGPSHSLPRELVYWDGTSWGVESWAALVEGKTGARAEVQRRGPPPLPRPHPMRKGLGREAVAWTLALHLLPSPPQGRQAPLGRGPGAHTQPPREPPGLLCGDRRVSFPRGPDLGPWGPQEAGAGGVRWDLGHEGGVGSAGVCWSPSQGARGGPSLPGHTNLHVPPGTTPRWPSGLKSPVGPGGVDETRPALWDQEPHCPGWCT